MLLASSGFPLEYSQRERHLFVAPFANIRGRGYSSLIQEMQTSTSTSRGRFQVSLQSFSLTDYRTSGLTRAKNESSYTNRPYVVQRLSPTVFEQSLKHKREFPDTRRLRMHIDYNEKELTLVYLAKNNPIFPLGARKQIL